MKPFHLPEPRKTYVRVLPYGFKYSWTQDDGDVPVINCFQSWGFVILREDCHYDFPTTQ